MKQKNINLTKHVNERWICLLKVYGPISMKFGPRRENTFKWSHIGAFIELYNASM
jgi:hypothetical protein